MALAAGSRLGSYEILAPLGAGGMGEVYRAHDSTLGRDVALKILAESFVQDSDRLARFKREAQVLASLNHPNIATIYGFEASDGIKALVLELVDGPTLADRIAQGPIPLDEALPIAKQISEALEAAHEQGIIHRDLKPANVKVRADGTVKVLDFGLAKAFDPTVASGAGATMSPTLSIHATQAGIILGTAAYMAPEQARGKPLDKRADIWAFGVVLYEMLTGRRLFEGETVSDTLIAVATKEPEWTRLPAAPGTNVRRLLRRCLEKDPQRRLRDIGDAWELLNESGQISGAPDAHGKGLHRFAWPIAALLFAVAGLLSFIHFRETARPQPELIRFQIPGSENTAALGSPYVSPNGRMIAFAARGPTGRTVLWIRSLDALDARALPGTEDAAPSLFWSPDNRFVGFVVRGNLKKAAVSGGLPQTLCDLLGFFVGGAWSRYGVIVFGSQGHPLMQVSESGGSPTPLIALDPSHENFHADPAFLPDGRHFVYRRVSASNERSGIYLGSLDLGPEQQSARRLVAATLGAVLCSLRGPGPGVLAVCARRVAGRAGVRQSPPGRDGGRRPDRRRVAGIQSPPVLSLGERRVSVPHRRPEPEHGALVVRSNREDTRNGWRTGPIQQRGLLARWDTSCGRHIKRSE
jgi:hypothetical protein